MGRRTTVGFLVAWLALPLTTLLGPAPVWAAGSSGQPSCTLPPTSAAKPVEITFWNSMLQANQTSISALTEAFNASQHRVHVTLVQFPSDQDLWTAYQTARATHSAPQLVELEDYRTQSAADSRSFQAVQPCLRANPALAGDILDPALSYWRVGGSQLAMPFALSEPVLIYNKASFVKAGLNPNDPPSTLAAYLTDAKAMKAKGLGTGLLVDPPQIEAWLASADQLLVDRQNGRTGRPTRALFDDQTGRRLFNLLDQLVRSGDAVTNPDTGPDAVDNLIGIGTGHYGMTLETSASLGTITKVLASGAFPGVQLGVAPFPTLDPPGTGGEDVGGIALYLPSGLSSLQQAAAWSYVTYLESTASQARFASDSGYLPVRGSAIRSAVLQGRWVQEPGYRVAWQELATTPARPAATGALIGPYEEFRQAMLSAEQAMFAGTSTPAQALAGAARSVNTILSGYNDRLPG